MPRTGGAVARRAAWSFSAQAISSTSNFLLTLVILAVADLGAFSRFSVGITTYMLVSQLARSAAAIPLLILSSDQPEGEGRPEHQAAAGVAVMVGLASTVLLLVMAAFSSDGREVFVILALAMPLLTFQEFIRYVTFARSQPHLAALSDGMWLTLQVTGSIVAWSQGWATVPVLLAVWAASGAVAGLGAGARVGVAPVFSGSLAWLKLHSGLCRKLVFEFFVNQGSYYLLLYGLAIIAGVGELGILRAAQTLIGPVIVVLLAGNALGIPESVRLRRDFRKLTSLCLFFSVSLAGAAVVWGFIVFIALPYIGPSVFPTSWETARPLIPVLSVFAAAVGVSTGAGSGLRAMGENAWILRSRAVTGGIALIIGLPLSRSMGADAVLIALAATESLFAAASWVQLLRSAGGSPDDQGEELESFVPF